MSCFELNEHVLRIREIPCPSCGLPRMHIFGFCGNFLLSLRYRFMNGIDFVFESVYLFDDVHLQKNRCNIASFYCVAVRFVF